MRASGPPTPVSGYLGRCINEGSRRNDAQPGVLPYYR